jgi:bacterioferritin-associated ferredoxin
MNVVVAVYHIDIAVLKVSNERSTIPIRKSIIYIVLFTIPYYCKRLYCCFLTCLCEYMMRITPTDDNPLVCFCFNVTQQEVMAVIQMDEVQTVMDITDHCKAGNGCSTCWPLLEELLALKPPK